MNKPSKLNEHSPLLYEVLGAHYADWDYNYQNFDDGMNSINQTLSPQDKEILLKELSVLIPMADGFQGELEEELNYCFESVDQARSFLVRLQERLSTGQ